MELGRLKDEYLGRVKEAAGVLANNDAWRDAGRRDQTAARVKAVSEDVKHKVDDITDRVVKRAKGATGSSGKSQD